MSTKSPVLWEAELKPSYLHRLLIATLYLACLLAIGQMQLPLFWSVAMSILVSVVVVVEIRQLTRPRLLQHIQFDSEQRKWRLYTCTDSLSGESLPYIAELQNTGYRTRLLVVLVLSNKKGRPRHVPVWCDQITPSGFSYLHQQLAFDPEDRRVRYSNDC